MSQTATAPISATVVARYHALDSLRAAMMLLGVVLHIAISYGIQPYGRAWPYKDASTNQVCDLLVNFIHVFRMPVFFVMAGFFAALLHDRRGLGAMLRNRTRRILVPFVVGWVVLFPLVRLAFHFAWSAGSYAPPPAVRETMEGNHPYTHPTTIHLWFLYDLLIFYVAVALAEVLASRLGAGRQGWLSRGLRVIVQSVCWRPLTLGAVTMLTLLPMRAGALETSMSFLPAPRVLAAYGIFFGFGWLFYAHRDLLPTFRRLAWTQVILATVAAFPANYLAVAQLRADPTHRPLPTLLTAAATGGLMTWLLIFGITGLFVRHFDRPLPRVRYLTDASYWVYLVHLPLVIFTVGLLAPVHLPALVKMATVLMLVTPVLLISYHHGVRSTVIGEWLNGTRYPRSLTTLSRAAVPTENLGTGSAGLS